MNLQIGQAASPTFAEPLALLSDCHRRVEYFLNLLDRLGETTGDAPLVPKEREALEVGLRYFREAAPRHTADEESSLFPRLRQSGHPQAAKVLARIEALEADHATAAPDHALLESCGQDWLAAGCLSPERRGAFRQAVSRLQALYRPHIALEDGEVFPLAAEILSATDLHEVGVEMARRRGLSAKPTITT